MLDPKIQLPVTDAYVHVQLLNGGSMTARSHLIHAGEEPTTEFRLYNWAFFIHHAKQGRRMLWDLGMSSVRLPLSRARVPPRNIRYSQVKGPRRFPPGYCQRAIKRGPGPGPPRAD